MIRLSHLVVAIASAFSNVGLLASLAAADRPNVIVIYTDDQGSVDMGCYGSKDLKTPAMDKLASRGVRFTQFYSAAPVCSPSRAGLLTGRYPWICGMANNAGAAPPESLNDLAKVEGPPIAFGKETTLAEMFRGAGYKTAHIGKWHLNSVEGCKPLDQGFDYSFGHMNGCIDNFSHFVYWNGENRHDLWENNKRVHQPGKFFPDLMVEKATAFITEHKDEPFFMYFAMNMPHYPYQGSPEWLDYYNEKKVPYPRNLYAAFLSTQDDKIGELLANLDKLKLTEKTIVILQSDNGHSIEVRAHGGGGSAGPYRGEKFSVYEGGIRLPAIISQPGTLPEGEVRDQLVHGCDWFPTLAELCDIPLPETAGPIHGLSVVKVIGSADADTPHDSVFWKSGGAYAVRQGDYKLVVQIRGGQKQLFNLATDVGEKNDLAKENPDRVEALLKRFESLE